MNPLNLEAAVARSVLALRAGAGRVLWLVLGLVVAGRFWCSYARVSLTQTAPVRPRGCVLVCVHVCARGCAPACVRAFL